MPEDNVLEAVAIKDDRSGSAEAHDAESSDKQSWEERRKAAPRVVGVEWYDSFHKFKNRYSETEGLNIIEVLMANWNTPNEISEEFIRQSGRKQPKRAWSTPDDQASWMDRIRIQSAPVVRLLIKVLSIGDKRDPTTPLTFTRPFGSLYHTLSQMEECHRVLKENPSHHARSADSREDATVVTLDPSEQGSIVDIKRLGIKDIQAAISKLPLENALAVNHLTCYLSFVKEHVKPLYETMSEMSKATHKMVNYSDLPCIFRAGELIYVPENHDPTNAPRQGSPYTRTDFQWVWRLSQLSFDERDSDGTNNTVHPLENTKIVLRCYRVDYNDSSYGPVVVSFTIAPFRGSKNILDLEVYPLRFADEASIMTDDLRCWGSRFISAVNMKHLHHEGWTLAPAPPKLDPKRKPATVASSWAIRPPTPRHVEGEVIIDFMEAGNTNPQHKVVLQSLRDESDQGWFMFDDVEIRHWSSETKLQLVGRTKERLVFGERYASDESDPVCKGLKLFNSWKFEKSPQTMISDADEDIALLPRRVYAYSLRERKFIVADVKNLRPLPLQGNIFKDLKINRDHKRMLKALVKDHFGRDSRTKQPPTSLNQDLIRGKGSGLVILLHGVPGVGKTATAEAIAYSNKKPLFPITCGDLGVTSRGVESALHTIFRLAHRWQCVLLLDEADTFLSRRQTSNLRRNALVSVFLRVLEYHSGILFLTTNRVGTIDEAFKSRIHLSLYYEPLSLSQTLAIFEVNIRKLEAMEAEQAAHTGVTGHNRPTLVVDRQDIMKYARWCYKHQRPWNGRQIRNAFQLASSIARFDMERTSLEEWDDDASLAVDPVLDRGQFELVAAAIEKFDDYLYQATAAHDEERALQEGIRADTYKPVRLRRDNRRDDPRGALLAHGSYYQPTQPRTTGVHLAPRQFEYESSSQRRPPAQKPHRQTHPARRLPQLTVSKPHSEYVNEYEATEVAEEYESEYTDEQAYDYGVASEQDDYDGGSG